MLINEGAVVDARDVEERTPLHLAVEEKLSESPQKLIARGVDRYCDSILHKAVLSENLSMVQILISHKVNIDAKNNRCTPLLRAFLNQYRVNTDFVSI